MTSRLQGLGFSYGLSIAMQTVLLGVQYTSGLSEETSRQLGPL